MDLQTKKRRSNAAGPSSQASRPAPQAVDDEPEEDDIQEEEDEDKPPAATQRSGLSDKDLAKAATQLVRLALTNEYRRVPLRRDVIIKSVIPNNRQAFNAVLQQARNQLRAVFGMELVELRKRATANHVAVNGDTQATQAQTQGKKKGKGRARQSNGDADGQESSDPEVDETVAATQTRRKVPGSSTYILRSTLPTALIESMSEPQPLNLFDARGNALMQDDDDADPGSIIDWRAGDASGSGTVEMLGIRTIILCLVMVQGRVISDNNLHAYLRRLNLSGETVLPYNSLESAAPPLTLDKYLDLLVKQGYLEKSRIASTVGRGEDTTAYEWRWGGREAEFSEKSAAQFLLEIFFPPDAEDQDDEADNARRRRRGQKSKAEERSEAMKKLETSIAKSAGSQLRGWS